MGVWRSLLVLVQSLSLLAYLCRWSLIFLILVSFIFSGLEPFPYIPLSLGDSVFQDCLAPKATWDKVRSSRKGALQRVQAAYYKVCTLSGTIHCDKCEWRATRSGVPIGRSFRKCRHRAPNPNAWRSTVLTENASRVL